MIKTRRIYDIPESDDGFRKLNIQELYSKQIKLIGSNGGNRRELIEFISYSNTIDDPLKIKVWKRFNLDNTIAFTNFYSSQYLPYLIIAFAR
jgi:hypothetical protein